MKNWGKTLSVQIVVILALCLSGCSDLGSQKKASESESRSSAVLQAPNPQETPPPSPEAATSAGGIKEEVLEE